jgi:hypothetical protein
LQRPNATGLAHHRFIDLSIAISTTSLRLLGLGFTQSHCNGRALRKALAQLQAGVLLAHLVEATRAQQSLQVALEELLVERSERRTRQRLQQQLAHPHAALVRVQHLDEAIARHPDRIRSPPPPNLDILGTLSFQ